MFKEEKEEKNLQKSIKIDEKLVFEALITYFQQSNYITESEGALLTLHQSQREESPPMPEYRLAVKNKPLPL